MLGQLFQIYCFCMFVSAKALRSRVKILLGANSIMSYSFYFGEIYS